MAREAIWYEDFGGFLTNENYYKVVPTSSMTLEEKLNAIVRLFIYVGVIAAVLRADYRFLFFGIVACLVSVALYEFERKQRAKAERFLATKDLEIVDNKVCARSTVDNPFMNPTLLDITTDEPRPPACAVDNEKVTAAIDDNFNARLFRDVGDLYGKMASQRQFYTVPSTTIPNDQDGFAKWCFGAGPTCKEGNGAQCSRNAFVDDAHRRSGQQ